MDYRRSMAANCGVKGPGHNMVLYLVVKHWVQRWRESGDTLGEGGRHCGRPRIASRECSRGFASATLDRKSR